MRLFIENLQEHTIGVIIIFLSLLFCYIAPFYLVDYSGYKLWYVTFLIIIPFSFIVLDGVRLFG